jgi:hypothetical protein
MNRIHALDIDLPARGAPVAEGDAVAIGPNRALTLAIVAVGGDSAWVRDLGKGGDGDVEFNAFWRPARDRLGVRP